jgi:hypothetical protein
MQARERRLARTRLDKELKYYRWAGREENSTQGLLREVRHALGVPTAELFRLEQSELRGTISLIRLHEVAEAMDCKLVYAIVPRNGKTLEELAEKREVGSRD